MRLYSVVFIIKLLQYIKLLIIVHDGKSVQFIHF